MSYTLRFRLKLFLFQRIPRRYKALIWKLGEKNRKKEQNLIYKHNHERSTS